MKFIKEFGIFEAYERPKSPDTNSKWTKNGTDEVATGVVANTNVKLKN